MSRVTLPALLALVLGLACTTPKEETPERVPAEPPSCTCGDADTALLGCAHPDCISGEGNPDNPMCVCGPLSLERLEDQDGKEEQE